MGKVTLIRATYTVPGQGPIDVLEMLTENQSKNYGAVDIAVSKIDGDLRNDNRITVDKNSDALKFSPPILAVDYADEKNAYHHQEFSLADVVRIGDRTTFGKFSQKPGEVLWEMGITAAKGQFVFVIVLGWTLVVVWTYKQFQFLQESFSPSGPAASPPYTPEKYGVLGQWVMYGLYCVFLGMNFPSQSVGVFFGKDRPSYSWMTKFLFAVLSALAPVAGFLFQTLIWFTAVQQIDSIPATTQA